MKNIKSFLHGIVSVFRYLSFHNSTFFPCYLKGSGITLTFDIWGLKGLLVETEFRPIVPITNPVTLQWNLSLSRSFTHFWGLKWSFILSVFVVSSSSFLYDSTTILIFPFLVSIFAPLHPLWPSSLTIFHLHISNSVPLPLYQTSVFFKSFYCN